MRHSSHRKRRKRFVWSMHKSSWIYFSIMSTQLPNLTNGKYQVKVFYIHIFLALFKTFTHSQEGSNILCAALHFNFKMCNLLFSFCFCTGKVVSAFSYRISDWCWYKCFVDALLCQTSTESGWPAFQSHECCVQRSAVRWMTCVAVPWLLLLCAGEAQ
jgi:hypothetical protein